jgi:3-hydroxy-9,10-secoandrosta-1,3,5(10)-triene-9,17-dione monooxygenase reductase component
MGEDQPERRLVLENLSPLELRGVLSNFATGVAVVTTHGPHGPVGMAVNSFTSVSLEPPLVLFCAGVTSTTWPVIEKTGQFCVNILGAAQDGLARRFARVGVDRFAGVGWQPSPADNPVLEGAEAWLDCRLDSTCPAGDHTVVIGRVEHAGVEPTPHGPLVFYRRRYARVWGEGVSARPVASIRAAVQERLACLPQSALPSTRVREAIDAHLHAVIDVAPEMKMIIGNLRNAPESVRAEIRVEERAYGEVWDDLLASAREQGWMPETLSPSIARMIVIGALNTVVEWWNPDKSSVNELAYTVCELLSSALSGADSKEQ